MRCRSLARCCSFGWSVFVVVHICFWWVVGGAVRVRLPCDDGFKVAKIGGGDTILHDTVLVLMVVLEASGDGGFRLFGTFFGWSLMVFSISARSVFIQVGSSFDTPLAWWCLDAATFSTFAGKFNSYGEINE
ncbi:unnamed protein product [Trifolium pratense]|uniref:Uncharacterized protein n=1 Tax=Trifolium pratense TaxID=57577 RepID=A0ACB0IVW7_TRIPR|nr:unnamed protein product [Trifolium pratense]